MGNRFNTKLRGQVPLSRIVNSQEMRFNPLRYAPVAEQALAKVMELAGSDEWIVERLGDFATIFNGPRFKRPFAAEGVKDGPTIIKMYTPKALFEERGESIKYLDLSIATPVQLRAIDVLTLRRDYIMIVDSGTAGKLLGKVGMTTNVHDGAVGNNNLIRVIIEDPVKRDYVYQFLRSELGQALLLRNVYGTNQDHIEPDDVKDIQVPILKNINQLSQITDRVREVVQLRERSSTLDLEATNGLKELLQGAFAESGVEMPETSAEMFED